jgi:hypothetical protein
MVSAAQETLTGGLFATDLPQGRDGHGPPARVSGCGDFGLTLASTNQRLSAPPRPRDRLGEAMNDAEPDGHLGVPIWSGNGIPGYSSPITEAPRLVRNAGLHCLRFPQPANSTAKDPGAGLAKAITSCAKRRKRVARIVFDSYSQGSAPSPRTQRPLQAGRGHPDPAVDQ